MVGGADGKGGTDPPGRLVKGGSPGRDGVSSGFVPKPEVFGIGGAPGGLALRIFKISSGCVRVEIWDALVSAGSLFALRFARSSSTFPEKVPEVPVGKLAGSNTEKKIG